MSRARAILAAAVVAAAFLAGARVHDEAYARVLEQERAERRTQRAGRPPRVRYLRDGVVYDSPPPPRPESTTPTASTESQP